MKMGIPGYALIAVFSINTTLFAAVDYWEVTKETVYMQTALNTQPTTATNWYFSVWVETGFTNDAASIELSGGGISGEVALVQYGLDWEFETNFMSQAELNAAIPENADFTLILSGGMLGTRTQQFNLGTDNYPVVPYLTGGDWQLLQAVEAFEPVELNWNSPNDTNGFVNFEISEGSGWEAGGSVYEKEWYGNTEKVQFSNILTPGSNYFGALSFRDAFAVSGTNGFGIGGSIGFASLTVFDIAAVNTATASDNFNDNWFNTNNWTQFEAEGASGISETNSHLEFVSDVLDDAEAWVWGPDTLSYTQDWSVAVNIRNLIDPGLFSTQAVYAGVAVFSGDPSNQVFSIEHITGTNGYRLETYVGDVLWTSNNIPGAQSTALKIAFDADTKRLYSTYSRGSDYRDGAVFDTAAWGLSNGSVFTAAVFFGTDSFAVSNGQLYADNFRIFADPEPISNSVSEVELIYTRDYGFFGTTNWLYNLYDIDVLTDWRVQSARFQLASGFNGAVQHVETEGDGLRWWYRVGVPIYYPWNPADDGDCIITLGYIDGTYRSTLISMTQEDGSTAIPVMGSQVFITSPDPLQNLATNTATLGIEWLATNSAANFVSIEVEQDENTIGDLFFADSITDEIGAIPVINGGLSNTSATVSLAAGTNVIAIMQGWGRTAYNSDGIGYVVSKGTKTAYLVLPVGASDGDAMPDEWEIAYFGSINAPNGGEMDDWDGDGLLNLEEYITGFDPTNSASFFAIEQSGFSTNGFIVSWIAANGREYDIHWNNTLTNGFGGAPLATVPAPQNSYTDTVHSAESIGFYLIKVKLQE